MSFMQTTTENNLQKWTNENAYLSHKTFNQYYNKYNKELDTFAKIHYINIDFDSTDDIYKKLFSNNDPNNLIEDSDIFDDEDLSEEFMKKLNKYYYQYKTFNKNKLNRGDILIVESINSKKTSRYRNDFVFIYTGSKIIELDFETDEYGCIPKEFCTFSEFPVCYWAYAISHNLIHNFDFKQLKFIENKDKDNDLYIYSIDYDGVTWKLASEDKIIVTKNNFIFSGNYNEDYPEYDFFIEEF